jgi:hypothetical protein
MMNRFMELVEKTGVHSRVCEGARPRPRQSLPNTRCNPLHTQWLPTTAEQAATARVVRASRSPTTPFWSKLEPPLTRPAAALPQLSGAR